MVLLIRAGFIWLQLSSLKRLQWAHGGWLRMAGLQRPYVARGFLGHRALHPAGLVLVTLDCLPRQQAEACKDFWGLGFEVWLCFSSLILLAKVTRTAQTLSRRENGLHLLIGNTKLYCKGHGYRGRVKNWDHFAVHHIWGPELKPLERQDIESRSQWGQAGPGPPPSPAKSSFLSECPSWLTD